MNSNQQLVSIDQGRVNCSLKYHQLKLVVEVPALGDRITRTMASALKTHSATWVLHFDSHTPSLIRMDASDF